MPRKGTGEYPDNWPEIASRIKREAGYRCVRCGHPNEKPSQRIPCDGFCDAARHIGGLNDGKQRVLTVHHLTMEKDISEKRWWAFLSLCQVCHLQIQHKVVMERPWLFDHTPWFRPYVAGYYAYHAGLPDDREYVIRHLAEILEHSQRGDLYDAMDAQEAVSTRQV